MSVYVGRVHDFHKEIKNCLGKHCMGANKYKALGSLFKIMGYFWGFLIVWLMYLGSLEIYPFHGYFREKQELVFFPLSLFLSV